MLGMLVLYLVAMFRGDCKLTIGIKINILWLILKMWGGVVTILPPSLQKLAPLDVPELIDTQLAIGTCNPVPEWHFKKLEVLIKSTFTLFSSISHTGERVLENKELGEWGKPPCHHMAFFTFLTLPSESECLNTGHWSGWFHWCYMWPALAKQGTSQGATSFSLSRNQQCRLFLSNTITQGIPIEAVELLFNYKGFTLTIPAWTHFMNDCVFC